jgi:hypothetical protein
LSASSTGISSAGLSFYNVSFTSAAATAITITGTNTFNTLSFAGRTTVGIAPVTFNANQTISTLTLNAGTAAAYRTYLASDTLGTPRTLAVTTLTAGAADCDFMDIVVTGTTLTGTRFGDCKGNSGITFDTPKTVYYRQTGSASWGVSGTGSWSLTNGGALDATAFPLAQDTAVFPSATYPASGSTTTINASYNIGTIDMSARTSNTMTLSCALAIAVYGDWKNGTGTTLSASNTTTFAGRGSQFITSAGKTFPQTVSINTPGGSVTLQDAFVNSNNTTSIFLLAGTFDAVSYNVTMNNSGTSFSSAVTSTRTLALGSGTWSFAGTTWTTTSTGLTVTGTGIISMISASPKSFDGGGVSYSGITLNQGGAGTLTITGNNTFKNITDTHTGATTVSLGATTQTLSQFTGAGTAGNLFSISGTTANLILTSGTVTASDYLSITGVRAYSLTTTWYAGANSVNISSLGWIFSAAPTPPVSGYGNFLLLFN